MNNITKQALLSYNHSNIARLTSSNLQCTHGKLQPGVVHPWGWLLKSPLHYYLVGS